MVKEKMWTIFVTALVMMLLGPILGVLFGAFGGWLAGLVFGETVLGALSKLGLHDVSMWQLGATLGFAGSYFKATLTTTKEKGTA
jgi:hypothetical protein